MHTTTTTIEAPTYTRQPVSPPGRGWINVQTGTRTYTVTLTIDDKALAKALGRKATRNATLTATMAGGCIIARATP